MTNDSEIPAIPLPDGFDAWYEETLVPKLASFERQRKKAMAAVLAAIVLGTPLVLGCVIIMKSSRSGGLWASVGSLVGLAVMVGGLRLSQVIMRRLKNELARPLYEFLGLDYEDVAVDFPLDDFVRAALFRAPDDPVTHANLRGTCKGVAFRSCQYMYTLNDPLTGRSEAEMPCLLFTSRADDAFPEATWVVGRSY